MATFQKKTVYHSNLTAAGRLLVRFTSDIRASKNGKDRYVAFNVDGDGSTYYYTLENQKVEEYIKRVPQGQWFWLSAAGSRDIAMVEVSDAGEREAASVPAQQPDRGPSTRAAAPPPAAGPRNGTTHINGHANGNGRPALFGQALACLLVAADIIDAFKQQRGREPTKREGHMAAMLFIEQNRSPHRVLRPAE